MRFLKTIICSLLLLSILCCFWSCTPQTPGEETDESETWWYLVKPDEDTLQAIGQENIWLVNKTYPSGPDYVPDVVELPTAYIINHDSIQMEKTAAKALCAMMAEMQADGIQDTFVTSGYRSYAYQAQLFDMYCQREAKAHPEMTQAQIEELVLTYSAKPGTSEHQTGLCADFMTQGMADLDNSFERTRAFEWLTENAYRFGFILRYPKDKVDITGYSYESWHYRFVGRNAAQAIHESQICLEEYLAGSVQ